jgi:hypothetical protein
VTLTTFFGFAGAVVVGVVAGALDAVVGGADPVVPALGESAMPLVVPVVQLASRPAAATTRTATLHARRAELGFVTATTVLDNPGRFVPG